VLVHAVRALPFPRAVVSAARHPGGRSTAVA
jgi:hypothetical protein